MEIPHITLFGETNVGKSSFINALTNQDISIVSNIKGTTTDVVKKRFELIPIGPIVLQDTAGINDQSELGFKRIEKTLRALKETNLAIIIKDIHTIDSDISFLKTKLDNYKIPYFVVINKVDQISENELKKLIMKYPDYYFISSIKKEITTIKEAIISFFQNKKEKLILLPYLPKNKNVVLVIPIDDAAPKGRIILPQMQILRECLDYNIIATCTQVKTLKQTLDSLKDVGIVITDSQAFKEVAKIVPKQTLLTSFSILFANYKGEINQLVDGCNYLEKLQKNAKVLIFESCSHNVTHDDIGKVKIPMLLQKKMQKDLILTHLNGRDFPDNIEEYDLIIHCGSCMLNEQTMESRLYEAKQKQIPIVNYGVLIAYLNGITERSLEIFKT